MPEGAVLCFRLYGPMAAWGAPGAVATDRPVLPRPGRGAILGLVAAALGIRQRDEAAHRALGNSLLVAVATHGRRRLAAEFRSAMETAPALTRRDGLAAPGGEIKNSIGIRGFTEDSLWRVFLHEVPGAEFTLGTIAAALREPEFMLCLGRREHPLALPPDPVLVEGGMADALSGYPVIPCFPDDPLLLPLRRSMHALEALFRRDEPADLGWDLGFPGAPDDGFTRQVQDDPMSRTHRRFMTRTEGFGRMREATRRGGAAEPAPMDLESFFEGADAA